jgi:hypothetical protein
MKKILKKHWVTLAVLSHQLSKSGYPPKIECCIAPFSVVPTKT